MSGLQKTVVTTASLVTAILVAPCLLFPSTAAADQPACPRKTCSAAIATISPPFNVCDSKPYVEGIGPPKHSPYTQAAMVSFSQKAYVAVKIDLRSSSEAGKRNECSSENVLESDFEDTLTDAEAWACMEELMARCRYLGY
jgi:hypothetical protein